MAIQAHLYSENFGVSLGAAQDLFMENDATGFHHSCLLPQQQHQKNPSFLVDNSIPFLPNNNFNHQYQQSMAFHQSVSTHLEKHRVEFEQLINLQKERLRVAIQERRKQQTSLVLKKYESKVQSLLQQKDEEIAKATIRAMELENFLKRMESEKQTWQRVAKESEAMAAALNSKMEGLRQRESADDAESCCINRQDEDATMVCRCCISRRSCVVILPCRHLCACTHCEVFLDACPVCGMVKKGCIEALF